MIIYVITHLISFHNWSCRGKIVVYSDFEVENKYLSLDELGKMLGRLSHQLPGKTII